MSIKLVSLTESAPTQLTPVSPRPVSTGGVVWLNISQPTDEDLDWLERTYHFHPLTIEDCRNFNQRAKVEAYTNGLLDGLPVSDGGAPAQPAGAHGYLFLSLTTMTRENGELFPQEMEVFLGPDYLITLHREPVAAIEAVRDWFLQNRTSPDTGSLKLRPDFLLYMIVDRMVDVYFPLLDEIEDEIDELEDKILENPKQETLQSIFTLKQQLVSLRRVTGPMRDVMNALSSTRYGLIQEHTALYFRDVFDHLMRVYELVETSRDLLGNALDAYLSTVSNRLAEVMKRLTLIATIFMPISFLASLGGINFQNMPFDNPAAFVVFLAIVAIVPIIMIIWFRRSRWV